MSERRIVITLLVDGACPLCKREISLLRWLDRGRGRLAFDDIAAPGFDPSRYGRALDELMASMHGALPDGSLVTGMEVFRRAYAAVGLGWLFAPTGWPIVGRLFDLLYALFARYRLTITGRGAASCDAGRCRRAG